MTLLYAMRLLDIFRLLDIEGVTHDLRCSDGLIHVRLFIVCIQLSAFWAGRRSNGIAMLTMLDWTPCEGLGLGVPHS